MFSGFQPKNKRTAAAVAALMDEHNAKAKAKAEKSSALKAALAKQKAGVGECWVVLGSVG